MCLKYEIQVTKLFGLKNGIIWSLIFRNITVYYEYKWPLTLTTFLTNNASATAQKNGRCQEVLM